LQVAVESREGAVALLRVKGADNLSSEQKPPMAGELDRSYVNIMPAGEIRFPCAGIETEVMLRSVRSVVLEEADASLGCACSGRIDWRDIQKTAVENKMGVLMLRGLDKNNKSMPGVQKERLEQYRLATVRMNTLNLITLRDVVPRLESVGVSPIIFKGPVAQKVIFGDFFSKLSSDVDMLVSPEKYHIAVRSFVTNGYSLASECSSFWWTGFLGEQHFVNSLARPPTLDLHYRAQQPGSPMPRYAERFISQSVAVSVGGVRVRTLSRTNTCLLSCMSLSKAFNHREAAGGYVCDIAAIIRRLRSEELKQLFSDAVMQGLENTLRLGLRSAGLLFGIEVRFDEGRGDIFKSTSDADLLKMILFPKSVDVRWPRRSKMLWDLCDNKKEYPGAFAWKVGGELCRLLYEARGRVPSRKEKR
jgi:hypothetical protein